MFYILHGDEEFVRSEEIAKLKAQIVQNGMGDLNIAMFDGRKTGLDELINACSTLPFLTNRRLVIVENLLQRFDPQGRSGRTSGTAATTPTGESDSVSLGKGAHEANSEPNREYAKGLLAYLRNLPPTTRLIFVEDKSLSRRNPILKQAPEIPNSYVREFRALDTPKLHDWIRQRAKAKGAAIERSAVSLLVSFVGQDLRLLSQELEKLAAYVGYARSISGDDVKALVSVASEENIFALVDSLGLRNRRQAMRHLQDLLASGASDLYLLAMIARQVRLILSVKDLGKEQGLKPDEIRRELHISHQFIVDKLLQQSRQFSMEELEDILRRLVEIDQAIKTGRIEGSLALELLVLAICRRQPGRVT